MGYVIRYTDGAYNQGSGFPCRLEEATVYASMTEAEAKAGDLADVGGVVPFDVAQLAEKGAVISFPQLADAIEAATIEFEVCAPSTDYYGRPEDWERKTIAIIDPATLLAALRG